MIPLSSILTSAEHYLGRARGFLSPLNSIGVVIAQHIAEKSLLKLPEITQLSPHLSLFFFQSWKKAGKQKERQQKKWCSQSKPWTEIGKQWKTSQDKRRNTIRDRQVDIPKTSTSYFCVKTNGNRNRAGLNWWGGHSPWVCRVCEGWYHTDSMPTFQKNLPRTALSSTSGSSSTGASGKAALAPGRSSSSGQVPPAPEAQG